MGWDVCQLGAYPLHASGVLLVGWARVRVAGAGGWVVLLVEGWHGCSTEPQRPGLALDTSCEKHLQTNAPHTTDDLLCGMAKVAQRMSQIPKSSGGAWVDVQHSTNAQSLRLCWVLGNLILPLNVV